MAGPLLVSFPPLSRADARVLILGSMPGAASLAMGQYYAHPRNLFWPMMGRLIGAGPDIPYDSRVGIVLDHRIAVWDVLQSCTREGSLDSAITAETPQDFGAFFAAHPQIAHIFFNGGKARQSFLRHDIPRVFTGTAPAMTQLPSTSPAHAARSFDDKYQSWSKILMV